MDQGIALNTLKIQIAALSVFLDQRLALEPLIKRFLLDRERLTPIRIKIPALESDVGVGGAHESY